ncbi:MAG: hypothetical protein JNJ45_09175 [Chthonomonas sp.]|nr:hypothetical protein [Chthonomonas sp.]
MTQTSEREEHHIATLRHLYPNIKSEASLLLCDILHGEDEDLQRSSCVYYQVRRYRIGHRQLIKKVERLLAEPFEQNFFDLHPLVSLLLEAIGAADTEASHDCLVRLLAASKNPWLTAFVIDGICWERNHYDHELVSSHLFEGQYECIIRSCIYAFMWHSPPATREQVRPFRAHPDRMVRYYVLNYLEHGCASRDDFEYFLADADEELREYAASILRNLDRD